MEYSLRDFLEMFRNADLDVEKYFNNYDTFFSLLNKKGLMDDVDPSDASDGYITTTVQSFMSGFKMS
jgi:hypothetical protein